MFLCKKCFIKENYYLHILLVILFSNRIKITPYDFVRGLNSMEFRLPVFLTAVIILTAFTIFNCFQSIRGFAADFKVNSDREKPVMQYGESMGKDKFIIVIDPGHGGKDSGSKGTSGQDEKDFTLKLSKKIAERFEDKPDFEAVLTRENDIFLSAKEHDRQAIANMIDADIFISVHGNTFADSSVSGTETYYFYDDSQELANILHERLVRATGLTDRGVRKEEFFVLVGTNIPAVLLEIGYLTNPEEEKLMLNPDFQDAVADAIFEGVVEYRNSR